MGFIKVLIEQTGVEMCVPESYYEKYKGSGIRYIEEVGNEGNPIKGMPEIKETYVELKDLCTAKGLSFKGNASKADLKKLLED